MTCKNCGKPKCTCGKDGCSTGAAVVIKNPTEYVNFRKVIIPASAGDEATNPPTPGKYCNVVLFYEATESVYIYSSDGVPTLVSDKSDIAAVKKALADETKAREDADQEIWTEIEAIEAASDVVDVVGTYAELEAYDTSKLHDKDLIKVLQDETHDDAITYYRWNASTDTFTYVGAEGPYYTCSETDILLSGKQDTLIAGTNIQIASDGKTISATDTTYSAFTGATSGAAGTSGLVPAPAVGDQDKVLKGDGSWGKSAANTIFYRNSSETGATRHIYKSPDMTGTASMQDLLDANEKGQVILRLSTASHPEDFSDAYLQNAYVGTSDYQMLFLDEKAYTSFDTTQPTDTTFYYSRRELQDKLTAGTNIQINGTTISATDTTYSNFVGATVQQAGSAGLVPAPTTSDPEKFLKGDGTWDEVSGATIFYLGSDLAKTDSSTSKNIYKNSGLTTSATATDLINAFLAGPVILRYTVGSNAVNEYLVSRMVQKSSSMADFYITRAERTYDSGTQAYVNEIGEFLLSTNGSTKTSSYFSAVTTVDTALSLQSNNPVANSTLTATIGDIETILQTLNSGNGVA